jgi:hypothetical protein
MPTVFSAKLDGSEAVRYSLVSLVAFYLRQARVRANSARLLPNGEEQLSESLVAVIFAALCLEAFSNEMGENTVPEPELRDFLMSRRKYQKPDGLASVSWKIITVFEKKWSFTLSPDEPLVKDVEQLFEMRNALVHYKIGDSSTKMYLPPPARIATEEAGGMMTVFDFVQRPTRVESPLVARVNSAAAAKSYNVALRILKLWNQKAGAPEDALSAHEELVES